MPDLDASAAHLSAWRSEVFDQRLCPIPNYYKFNFQIWWNMLSAIYNPRCTRRHPAPNPRVRVFLALYGANQFNSGGLNNRCPNKRISRNFRHEKNQISALSSLSSTK